jgi:GH24 family phage-related lysozyme (muramidase)
VVPQSISDEALLHLQATEGAIPYVYDDGDGTWPKKKVVSFSDVKGYPTIGVGHRIFDNEQHRFAEFLAGGRTMTTGEMSDLLQDDINSRIATSSFRSRIQVPITQSMWDALVMHAFNTGPNAKSVKSAIDFINASAWEQAAAALGSGPTTSKGKTLSGLVKRRAEEAALFLRDGVPDLTTGVANTLPGWVWWLVGGISTAAVGVFTVILMRKLRDREE